MNYQQAQQALVDAYNASRIDYTELSRRQDALVRIKRTYHFRLQSAKFAIWANV